jgi:hypothetical protein
MTTTDIAVRPIQVAGIPAKLDYARALAKSGLLPKEYRDHPENVLYACEYGEMLGLPPMAAINGIHVIDGKPTASAALISALVRRAGHKLRVTGTDTQAVAQIVRADDPDFTFEAKWDLFRAKTAGLAGKGTWQKYPAAMLKARAITEVARDACEEALCGMHYTAEELGAEVDENGAIIGEVVRDDPAAGKVAALTADALAFTDDESFQREWKKIVAAVRDGEIPKQEGGRIQGAMRERWQAMNRQDADAEGTSGDGIAEAEVVTSALPGDWDLAVAGIGEWEEAERLLGEVEADTALADDLRAEITAAIQARVVDITERAGAAA